ncbi:MAG: hypothetical protein HY791_09630 [Deltaproteobacteria bacterium]|nr:hypothetical protein [Deltaproteobacteria bacterium]
MTWVIVGALIVALVLGYVVFFGGKAERAPSGPTPSSLPEKPSVTLDLVRFDKGGMTTIADRPDDRTFASKDGSGLRVSVFPTRIDVPADVTDQKALETYFAECLALYGGRVVSVELGKVLEAPSYEVTAALSPPAAQMYICSLGVMFEQKSLSVHAWSSQSVEAARSLLSRTRASLAWVGPAPGGSSKHDPDEKPLSKLTRAFGPQRESVGRTLARAALGLEGDAALVDALIGITAAEDSVESAYDLIAAALPDTRRDAESMKKAGVAARDLVSWWNGEGRARVHTPHLVEHGLWSRSSSAGVGRRVS